MPQTLVTREAWQLRIDRALERCRVGGWRVTPIRRRAIELMCRTSGSLKAYELVQDMGEGGSAASPMRVYRALEFLITHGFVRHLKSINAFAWCEHSDSTSEAPFLICDQCGTTIALVDTHMKEILIERAERLGFEANLKTMELHGLCRKCVEVSAA